MAKMLIMLSILLALALSSALAWSPAFQAVLSSGAAPATPSKEYAFPSGMLNEEAARDIMVPQGGMINVHS